MCVWLLTLTALNTLGLLYLFGLIGKRGSRHISDAGVLICTLVGNPLDLNEDAIDGLRLLLPAAVEQVESLHITLLSSTVATGPVRPNTLTFSSANRVLYYR